MTVSNDTKHVEFELKLNCLTRYNLFSYYGITNRTNYVIEQIRQTVDVTEFRYVHVYIQIHYHPNNLEYKMRERERERVCLVGSLTAHNIKPILNFLNDFIADFRIMLTGVSWLIH